MFRYSPVLLYFLLLASACKHDPAPTEQLTEFYRTYPVPGNQLAHRLIVDANGILIIGTSEVGGQSSMMLMRTDLDGHKLWTRLIATDRNGEGHGMARTSDGGLILVGSQRTETFKDILLVRTDANGAVLWEKPFGGPMNDIGRDVIALEQGGFMVIGTTSSFGLGVADMYVIRTDDSGNELWSRTFGGLSLDGGSELVQVDQFQVMLLGFTESFGAGYRDLWLQSVSVDGDSLWGSTYGGADYEESQGLYRAANGSFILCGHSASIDPVHAMHGLRIGQDGTVQWEHHFGTTGVHDGGEGVLEDTDGNLLFVGRSDSFGQGEQVYLVKTDATGDIISEESFGGAGSQWATDVAESPTSHYIIGSSAIDGDADVLLIKRPK